MNSPSGPQGWLDRAGGPWAAAIVLQGALALWYVLTPAVGDAAWHGFPLDDAWIHMVYGRNVAAHGLPFYNDTIEAGFSSPLWMLALALAHWVSAILPCSAVVAAKLFGVAAAVVASAGVGRLVARLGGRRGVAVLATALCACNPVLAFAQVSGMEVAITTACAVLAALALAADRHGRCGVWLALAYLGRPECALLAMLFAFVPFAATSLPMRTRWWRAACLVAPVAVVGLAWAGYCWCATGHVLPNTFYAKFALDEAGRPWEVVADMLASLPANWLGVGVVFALLAPWGGAPADRGLRVCLPMFAGLFAFVVARTRPCPIAADEYFFFTRYVAPAWPFLAAATALGVDLVSRRVGDLRGRVVRPFGLAVVALSVAVLLARHPAALATSADRYARNCQNIDEVQVAFGRWVAATVPPGRAVALNDAGALRYFGGRECVDLMGLNDQRVLFAEPPLAAVITGPDAMADWLLRHRVDHLIVFPAWFESLVRHPRFAARFAEVQRLASADYSIADPRSGQATMVAYRVLPGPTAAPGR